MLYERDFSTSLRQTPPLSSDERLFLASTFHALEALSSGEIGPSAADIVHVNTPSSTTSTKTGLFSSSRNATSPAIVSSPSSTSTPFFVSPSSGIATLDTASFRLHCYQTFTGLKFVGIGSPAHGSLEAILRAICLLYADYALKNPFYRIGMPIRCELFEEKLGQYISSKQGIQ